LLRLLRQRRRKNLIVYEMVSNVTINGFASRAVAMGSWMKVWAGLSVQMEASFVAIMASLDLSSVNKDLNGKVSSKN